MMWKSPHIKKKMVYVVRVNRIVRNNKERQKYKNHGSRIVYIGMTAKGTQRPSGSMYRIAEKAFKLRGVRTVKVFLLAPTKRQRVKSWEHLESQMLRHFKEFFGFYPYFNKKAGRVSNSFSKKRLDSIIDELS